MSTTAKWYTTSALGTEDPASKANTMLSAAMLSVLAIGGDTGYSEPLIEIKKQYLKRQQSKNAVDHSTSLFTGTFRISHFTDPSAAYSPDGPIRTWLEAYQTRIEQLRIYAEEDGDSINPESERDFWHIVKSTPAFRRGGLVLTDDGDLRAVWKGKHEEHLGLQFLGGEMLEYVIFKRREANQPISRVAGQDTFDGVEKQITAFDLDSLLYE